jgi:LacI family transcriptional regulator
MADVARRAGVHVATVSRALRDDPRISPGRRQQIQRAAQELDYRPHPLVAALMSVRGAGRALDYHATLACITKNTAEETAAFRRNFGQLIAGAREHALARGYRLEEFNLGGKSLTARRLSDILRHRNVHGLLIAPLQTVHEELDLDWAQFSTLAVGHSLSHVAVNRIAHNHLAGMAEALRRCRAAGWRRFGLVLPRFVHEKVQKRWVAALLLDQSEQPAADRVPPLLPEALEQPSFARWFRKHRPEVVLSVQVPQITGWLQRLGCTVPRDVSLVSLDRRPADTGIAGIDQEYASWGARAADLLIGLLQRNERGLPVRPFTVQTDGVWADGRTLARRA